MKKEYDVIIVGAGPTGIFTALELLKQKSELAILILEKGNNLEKRVCPMNTRKTPCVKCPSCAIVSGWGGAGAYSDGKLTLTPEIGGNLHEYIGRDNLSELIQYVDEIYIKYGAPDRVLGVDEARLAQLKEKAIRAGLEFIPARLRQLGTGYSQTVLQAMEDDILEQGADIAYGENVKTLLVEEGRIVGVKTASGKEVRARYVVAAPGRENAEWLSNEAKRLKIGMKVNPVDIGVRVECPAVITKELTDNIYESKLVYQTPTFDDRVRTFCMSPYGQVVNENNQGLITVNGHS